MSDVSSLTGPQKAAIFLLSMGEQFTTQIFGKLDDEEIKHLGRAMSRLEGTPPEVVREVMGEFSELMSSQMEILMKGDAFVKKIISQSVTEERAENILEDIGSDLGPVPFGNLRELDSKVLANFIQHEHPQTIALILAHLDPAKAAEVISEFSENLQTDILMRIANLETVPHSVINEIESVLDKEVNALGSVETRKLGGASTVAEILNHVDHATENNILTKIEEDRLELANDIRKLMFVFDDLADVDDRGIRDILREVNNEELTLSLKTASEAMKQKILGNLSERASKIIEEDLEIMGPVRLADVEKAQQSVLRVAKKLETEGKIMLGKGGEETFV